MKDRKKHIIILLCLGSCLLALGSIVAQNSSYHLGGWIGSGYTNLMHKGLSTDAKSIGGGGLLLAAGFEYRYKTGEWSNFILNTGLEFDWKNSTTKLLDFQSRLGKIVDENTNLEISPGTVITPNMRPIAEGGVFDTEGEVFAASYHFKKYRDVYNVGYLNLPIMAGMTFEDKVHQTGEYYFLAGIKTGFGIFAKAKSSSQHSVTGMYPNFITEFEEMPEHFLVNNINTSNTSSFKLGFNLAASAEVGYTFSKKLNIDPKITARIAVFADYGVLNILPKDNVNTDVVSTGDFIGYQINRDNYLDTKVVKHNAFLTSNQASSASSHPLFVGVKLTILYDATAKPKVYPAIKVNVKDKEHTRDSIAKHFTVYKTDSIFTGEKTQHIVKIKSVELKEEYFAGTPKITAGKEIPPTIKLKKGQTVEYVHKITKRSCDTIYSVDTLMITDSIFVKVAKSIIEIENLKVGDTITIGNALFDVDKYDLKEDFKAELKKFAEYLVAHPSINIEILGHTDNTGSKKHNFELSKHRAKAIYDFLKDNGVIARRMAHEGFADEKPVASNATSEGRAKNRRTEIIIK